MINRKKFLSASAHLFASLALGLFVFSASVPVALAADVGPPPTVCWLPSECLGKAVSQTATSGTASCSGDRCFQSDSRCPSGQGKCFANPPPVPLVIHIGGAGQALDLGDYIAKIFNYGIYVAGILAAVMFIVGGFQYLTAGGSDRVKVAKKRITDSVVGLLLILGSFVMLNTINPDILKLQMPRIEVTQKKTFASCAFTETCEPCGVPYFVLTDKATGKTASSTGDCLYAKLQTDLTDAVTAQYDVSTQCVGKGCGSSIPTAGGEATCSEASFRCKPAVSGATAPSTFACGHQPDAAKAANSTYSCQSCKADGQDCGTAGPSDDCCGGYCAATLIGGNKCASGEPGDSCQDNSQCKSGICQTHFGNSCSNGDVGSPCAANSECKSGTFCAQVTSVGVTIFATCTPGAQFSYCGNDSQCASGLHCINITGYNPVCMPRSVADSRAAFKAAVCNPAANGIILDDCCNTNADCGGRGGYCNTNGSNFCTNGSTGSPCDNNSECTSNKCAKHICVTGENGALCADDSQCDSGHCYTGGDFPSCTSGGIGARCNVGQDCNPKLTCTSDHRCVEKTS